MLAAFKAEVLNDFVQQEHIRSIVEFGCGDGNQLRLAAYPRYLGLDVSRAAVKRCIDLFAHDRTKSFFYYDPAAYRDPAHFVTGELALSLDVVFHLVEDSVFDRYMRDLFESATRFVAIYSSNEDALMPGPHERHRRFTDWIASSQPDWELLKTVANRYPFNPSTTTGSRASFYFFSRSPLTTSQTKRGASVA